MGKTGMSLKLEDLSLEDIRASVYSNTKSELYDVLKKLKDELEDPELS